jgi:hypothetical protein
MYTLLKDHALRNVWSSPSQDYQYIFKPPRIGPPSGNTFSVTIHRNQFYLPNSKNVFFFESGGVRRFSYKTNLDARPFVVFDLGPLPPWLVNLPERKGMWYPIPELMNGRNLDVWLYKKSGIRIPSQLGYIQRIRDNSFLLAVELTSRYQWDLNDPDEDLYIRFYSNAFFESERFLQGGYDSTRGIDYIGGYYPTDISQQTMAVWLAPKLGIVQASQTNAKGGLYAFADGKLIWPFSNVNSLPNNSYIEVVFDRSIYRTAKLRISDLPGFDSDLDSKAKRVYVPWLKDKETKIEFQDDVDFCVGRGNRGVYYHKNQVDAVRQLTHESYTLTEQYIEGYINDNPWLDANDPTYPLEEPFILARIRHSGWNRALVWEHMHLREMIKLGYADFMEALTGSQSNVPMWRAEYIENSKYNMIQRAWDENDFTWQDVFEAYGYNAAAKMLLPTDVDGLNNGNAPSGLIYYDTPPSFKHITLLVFDRVGNFLGCRAGAGGASMSFPVTVGNMDSYFQHGKFIAGKLTQNAVGSSFYGDTVVSNGIPVLEQGFQCYICNLVSGLPDNEWRVVEEDEGYWEISSDGLEIIWDEIALTNASSYPAVRFNNHVIYQEAVPFQEEEDGVLQFSINNTVTVEGNAEPLVEYIPYASLLVFVERKLLVENIDYYIEWPQIVVTKKYANKQVSLIMSGITADDLTRKTVRESGWAYRGVLSADTRWHVRDDRNIIISYGGNVIHPSLVKSYENYWEVTGFKVPSIHMSAVPYSMTDVVPYSVNDVLQTIDPIYPGFTTVEEYERSVGNDTIVEDYMTEHMDFFVPTEPNTTSTFWKLYTPFISRIIGEMIAGRFDDLGPINELSTQSIQELVEPFIWLLDFDPILRDVDLTNCTVLPHCYNQPVGVTLNQYMFIKRLVDMYLDGKINLSPMLVVEE